MADVHEDMQRARAELQQAVESFNAGLQSLTLALVRGEVAECHLEAHNALRRGLQGMLVSAELALESLNRQASLRSSTSQN